MTTKPAETMNLADSASTSLRSPYFDSVGRRLRSRRVLLVLAAIALVFGAALNWSWLVAAGVAPILIGLLPCAAMCALGLCMHKVMDRSNASEPTAEAPIEASAAPSAKILGRQSSCCVEERESERRPADAPQR